MTLLSLIFTRNYALGGAGVVMKQEFFFVYNKLIDVLSYLKCAVRSFRGQPVPDNKCFFHPSSPALISL